MRKTILIVLIFTLTPGVSQVNSKHHEFTETIGSVDFIMKAIPAGSFEMGCGIKDSPCHEAGVAMFQNETDPTFLRHVEAFYMAETETTWSLYELCIKAKQCRNNDSDGGDNGWGKGDRPVIEVSWDDVTTEFIPWLNQVTKKHYRLPTEAEWEYAARAQTINKYSWGTTINCSLARYGYMSKECGSQAATDPVKSYPPNGFGLYDMHGNVWEFVQDCWRNTLPEMPEFADEVACNEIVMKGGSWLNKAFHLRTAARYNHNRSYRESGDGFRLAMDKVE